MPFDVSIDMPAFFYFFFTFFYFFPITQLDASRYSNEGFVKETLLSLVELLQVRAASGEAHLFCSNVVFFSASRATKRRASRHPLRWTAKFHFLVLSTRLV